jgi:signal transduction histidine kinase
VDQYIATGNKAHLQSIDTILEKINESFDSLEIYENDEDNIKLLNEIENSFSTYKILIRSLISFYEKTPDENEISTKKIRIDSLLENSLLVKLNSIYESERSEISKLMQDARNLYFNYSWAIVLFAMFLIILGVMASFLISRSITEPLAKMAKIVPSISEGKFGQVVDIKSEDEIGDLASAFNQMTKDLKKSQNEIRMHSQELEQKVQERTSELDEKVKELSGTKTAVLNMMEDMDGANKQLIRTQEELEKSLAELKETDIKKDQFISIAAHELKTPLTSIHGFSQLLQNRKVANNFTKRNKYLKIMDHETKRLGKLVGDILDLSRIDLGTIKVDVSSVNLNEMIENIRKEMNIQIEEKGLKSEYDIEKDLPPIQTDNEKLTEILLNLINNSVKYTQEGKISVSVYKENNKIHFMVKDTGIGISKKNHEKVFDRFYQVDSSYTRKAGGTGLGLSLCREFVQLLGGKIWLKSELGKGTEFHFTLPVSITAQQKDRKARAEETIRMAKKMQKDIKKIGFGSTE